MMDSLPKHLQCNVENQTNSSSFSAFKLAQVAGSEIEMKNFTNPGLTLSLLRVINVKIPLQPHKKYDITQYGELDFS